MAPCITPWSHEALDWEHIAAPPQFEASHWLGTDRLGRDLFARGMQALRVSLLIGVLAALVSVCIGVAWGATAGYLGGRIDAAMMRFVDIVYALPYVFIVIILSTMFPRGSIAALFIAIGAVGWLTMARIVRGQTLTLRKREFVDAAIASGVRTPRHPLATHRAERDWPGDRLRDAGDPADDPVRELPELSRARRPGAIRESRHAHQQRLAGDGVIALDAARTRDVADCAVAGIQPARRRTARRASSRAMTEVEPLLEVESFRRLRRGDGRATASFEIARGHCLGVIGESGAGKTQAFLALMGLLPRGARVTGGARLAGRALLIAPRRRARPATSR